jgi:hypothetical protein
MGTGHEEQEGQHGKLCEAGMGLEGVKPKDPTETSQSRVALHF